MSSPSRELSFLTLTKYHNFPASTPDTNLPKTAKKICNWVVLIKSLSTSWETAAATLESYVLAAAVLTILTNRLIKVMWVCIDLCRNIWEIRQVRQNYGVWFAVFQSLHWQDSCTWHENEHHQPEQTKGSHQRQYWSRHWRCSVLPHKNTS